MMRARCHPTRYTGFNTDEFGFLIYNSKGTAYTDLYFKQFLPVKQWTHICLSVTAAGEGRVHVSYLLLSGSWQGILLRLFLIPSSRWGPPSNPIILSLPLSSHPFPLPETNHTQTPSKGTEMDSCSSVPALAAARGATGLPVLCRR